MNIIFKIGTTKKDLFAFVYKLGAHRLDELLRAESEEAIRTFIQSVKHTDVQDLKSEMANQLISDLNTKFNIFGVYFESVAITSINLPKGLEDTFAQTTKYDIMLQNQAKKHENEKLVIENEENRKMSNLQRDNYRKLEKLRADKDRALIEREQQRIYAQTEFEVDVVESEKKVSVLKTKLEGQKLVTENQAKKKVVEMVYNANAEAIAKKTEGYYNLADQKKWATIRKADAFFESTKLKSDALLKEAETEMKIAEAMKQKRTYELEMARIEVLES